MPPPIGMSSGLGLGVPRAATSSGSLPAAGGADADPTDLLAISSLLAWWDSSNDDCWYEEAGEDDTLATDDQHFHRWEDRSGNDHHLSSLGTADSATPVFYTAGSDSKPFVQSSADLIETSIGTRTFPVTFVFLIEQGLITTPAASDPMYGRVFPGKYHVAFWHLGGPGFAYNIASGWLEGGVWRHLALWEAQPIDGSLYSFAITIPDDARSDLRVDGGAALTPWKHDAHGTDYQAYTYTQGGGGLGNFPYDINTVMNIYECMVFDDVLSTVDLETVFQYLAAAHPSLTVTTVS